MAFSPTSPMGSSSRARPERRARPGSPTRAAWATSRWAPTGTCGSSRARNRHRAPTARWPPPARGSSTGYTERRHQPHPRRGDPPQPGWIGLPRRRSLVHQGADAIARITPRRDRQPAVLQRSASGQPAGVIAPGPDGPRGSPSRAADGWEPGPVAERVGRALLASELLEPPLTPTFIAAGANNQMFYAAGDAIGEMPTVGPPFPLVIPLEDADRAPLAPVELAPGPDGNECRSRRARESSGRSPRDET